MLTPTPNQGSELPAVVLRTADLRLQLFTCKGRPALGLESGAVCSAAVRPARARGTCRVASPYPPALLPAPPPLPSACPLPLSTPAPPIPLRFARVSSARLRPFPSAGPFPTVPSPSARAVGGLALQPGSPRAEGVAVGGSR